MKWISFIIISIFSIIQFVIWLGVSIWVCIVLYRGLFVSDLVIDNTQMVMIVLYFIWTNVTAHLILNLKNSGE